jgi:hypothetical protein
MLTAEALLAGPRGRRLCWELLRAGLPDSFAESHAWVELWTVAYAGDLSGHVTELAGAVSRVDLVALAADSATVLQALRMSVDRARYWQGPDGEDQALVPAAVAAVLGPVAAAVAAAPGCRWWESAMDPGRQWYVQFLGGHPLDEPQLTGAAERVAAWCEGTSGREAELRRDPPEPLGAWSGPWWSDPALSGLPVTTRSVPGLAALRLALVEDGMGWEQARCWPLRPRPGARVYEVDGPDAWSALVTWYPLDVTRSRRHDWWHATGQEGSWLIPNYQAVARDYDAVHVSVLGYLTTAGVAVPAGAGDHARTLLAGWDPDATWWLTDSLAPAGRPDEWAADDSPVGWRPAG